MLGNSYQSWGSKKCITHRLGDGQGYPFTTVAFGGFLSSAELAILSDDNVLAIQSLTASSIKSSSISAPSSRKTRDRGKKVPGHHELRYFPPMTAQQIATQRLREQFSAEEAKLRSNTTNSRPSSREKVKNRSKHEIDSEYGDAMKDSLEKEIEKPIWLTHTENSKKISRKVTFDLQEDSQKQENLSNEKKLKGEISIDLEKKNILEIKGEESKESQQKDEEDEDEEFATFPQEWQPRLITAIPSTPSLILTFSVSPYPIFHLFNPSTNQSRPLWPEISLGRRARFKHITAMCATVVGRQVILILGLSGPYQCVECYTLAGERIATSKNGGEGPLLGQFRDITSLAVKSEIAKRVGPAQGIQSPKNIIESPSAKTKFFTKDHTTAKRLMSIHPDGLCPLQFRKYDLEDFVWPKKDESEAQYSDDNNDDELTNDKSEQNNKSSKVHSIAVPGDSLGDEDSDTNSEDEEQPERRRIRKQQREIRELQQREQRARLRAAAADVEPDIFHYPYAPTWFLGIVSHSTLIAALNEPRRTANFVIGQRPRDPQIYDIFYRISEGTSGQLILKYGKLPITMRPESRSKKKNENSDNHKKTNRKSRNVNEDELDSDISEEGFYIVNQQLLNDETSPILYRSLYELIRAHRFLDTSEEPRDHLLIAAVDRGNFRVQQLRLFWTRNKFFSPTLEAVSYIGGPRDVHCHLIDPILVAWSPKGDLAILDCTSGGSNLTSINSRDSNSRLGNPLCLTASQNTTSSISKNSGNTSNSRSNRGNILLRSDNITPRNGTRITTTLHILSPFYEWMKAIRLPYQALGEIQAGSLQRRRQEESSVMQSSAPTVSYNTSSLPSLPSSNTANSTPHNTTPRNSSVNSMTKTTTTSQYQHMTWMSFSPAGQLAIGYHGGGVYVFGETKSYTTLGTLLTSLEQRSLEKIITEFLTFDDIRVLRNTCRFLHNFTRELRLAFRFVPMELALNGVSSTADSLISTASQHTSLPSLKIRRPQKEISASISGLSNEDDNISWNSRRLELSHQVPVSFLRCARIGPDGRDKPFFPLNAILDRHQLAVCPFFLQGRCSLKKCTAGSHLDAEIDREELAMIGAYLLFDDFSSLITRFFGPQFYWRLELFIEELFAAYSVPVMLRLRGVSSNSEKNNDHKSFDDDSTQGKPVATTSIPLWLTTTGSIASTGDAGNLPTESLISSNELVIQPKSDIILARPVRHALPKPPVVVNRIERATEVRVLHFHAYLEIILILEEHRIGVSPIKTHKLFRDTPPKPKQRHIFNSYAPQDNIGERDILPDLMRQYDRPIDVPPNRAVKGRVLITRKGFQNAIRSAPNPVAEHVAMFKSHADHASQRIARLFS